MPKVGDLRVWNGAGWTTLKVGSGAVDPDLIATGTLGPFSIDPETTGMPPPVAWEPPEDMKWDELLEILLCPECDFELGAAPCGATHAFLADNPMRHRLLYPLLEQYLKTIRAEGKQCTMCEVPLATGDCTHADVRDDQVTMNRTEWIRIIDDLGALHGLRDRVDDLIEERAQWAEDAVEKVATLEPWNGKLHPAFLADLRAELRRVS